VNTLGYNIDEKFSTALKTVYRVLNNLVMKEESEAKVMRRSCSQHNWPNTQCRNGRYKPVETRVCFENTKTDEQ